MAITYPLSLPSTPSFRSLLIMPEQVVPRIESPFTLQSQSYDYSGQRWKVEITYPPLSPDQYRSIKAFLLSLKGSQGTFFAGDPLDSAPSGVGSGIPVVNGDQLAGANTLNVTGFTATTTNILKAGDNFQLGNYLYTNLKDVSSNGSGSCTLDIWPNLRAGVANGTSITLQYPKSLFKLDSEEVVFSTGVDRVYNISFVGVEAI